MPLRYLLGCLSLILSLAACAPPPSATTPLPTIAAIAHVPTATATLLPIPATFTPLPEHYATATHTITPTPTDTATPTPTLATTPTPTRFTVPDFLNISAANAPFLETPPTSTDCSGGGLLFRSQFPSSLAGPLVDYHAYLPPCYGQDGRTYPHLILLHGSIQTDSHWPDLGLAYHADAGIGNGRYPPFIALMPNLGQLGNNTSGGDGSIEGLIINNFLPFVDSTFCSEATARSIGGISRGAYWALMIAFRHPDTFTAVSGHSSQLRLDVDDARYNPLTTYAQADLSQMHIWLDWGQTDFLRNGSQALADNLAEAQIAATIRIFGGGHNERYWQVNLREYLDWHTAVWPSERENYPAC